MLNVGFEATTALKLGNETIEFKARFGGLAREIVVPVDHVVAIYARENGQGMAFPVPTVPGAAPTEQTAGDAHPADGTPLRGLRLATTEADTAPLATTVPRLLPDEPPEPSSPRPSLKRIK